MPNAEKTGAVAAIRERFANSSATVITEYRGLSVQQVTDLRRALGRDTTYAVVKNTLTKRAAADAGVPIDDSLLVGPTAIAFVHGDPVEAAKGLRDFARTNPLLVIKGGILDGKVLSAAEIARIADLESREVLLAKLAGAIKALPTRAAGLFQAPLTQLARVMKALEDKMPDDEAIPADHESMIGNMKRETGVGEEAPAEPAPSPSPDEGEPAPSPSPDEATDAPAEPAE